MRLMSRTIQVFWGMVFAILSIPSYASDETSTIWFESDIPLVLTATRLEQPINESPVSISIMDRQTIQATGAKSIPELFRFVPGMQVGYVRGNFPVVAYQGLTSEFPQGVQVLIDGMSVYSPLFGGVIWNSLPIQLEDIERIEVVRGPNSASYGANSFQSVIHITTTHSAQDQGTRASLLSGGNDNHRLRLTHSASIDRLSYRVNAVTEHLDRYNKLHDDVLNQSLNARFDYQPNIADQLQLNLSLFNSNRETADPSFSFINPFDPPRNRDESAQYLQLRWEHHESSENSWLQQLSYHRFNAVDRYVTQIGPLTIPINAGAETQRWDFEIQRLTSLNPAIRLVWGMGAIYDNVYLPLRLNQNDTLSNHRERAFAHLEWRANDAWLINTGLLAEYDELSGSIFSPRLGLTYLATPEHAWRLNVTRAYRTPVLAEEYRETVLNGFTLQSSAGHLDPEQVESIETGYHGLFLASGLNLDAKLFHNRYRKLINNSIDGLLVIDNQHHATVSGFELEIRYQPSPHRLLHFNYAWNDTSSDNPRHEASVPEHALSALWSEHWHDHWQTSLAYHQTGSMRYLGNANVSQGPFRRLDGMLQKSVQLTPGSALDMRFLAQLSLDTNRDFHQRATPDDRVMIELEYHFD